MNIIFNFIGLIMAVSILLGKYDTDYLSYFINNKYIVQH